jgi:amino acid adenylation domain-containing protein
MAEPELSAAKRALLERRLRGKAAIEDRAPTIPRRTGRGSAVLSPMQQRLWFLDQLRPGEAFATIDYALRLPQWVDEHVLERSVNFLVARHETLRTAFVSREGRPRQVIAEHADVPLAIVDLRHLAAGAREAEVARLATEQARRPFDLSAAPLLRTTLVRIGALDHVFLLAMHHIVSDGWSMRILFDELQQAYQAYARGGEPVLEPLAVHYADFAEWQQQRLDAGVLDSQLSHWRAQLRDLPVVELPADRPRPAMQTFNGATHTAAIPEALAQRLRELGRRHEATLFMTLLAAFAVQLGRYCGQEDIPAGTYVSGRSHTELEALVGFFVNLLVLRCDISGDPSFTELLARVRETALQAYANQDVPFEKLVEELDPERDPSRNPLCQVAFQLFTPPPRASGGPDSSGAALLAVDRGTANFDLVLSIAESGDGLRADFEYNSDLFDGPSVQRMASHYLRLLAGVAADPTRPLSQIGLLTEDERRLVVEEFNATAVPYALDPGIAARFLAQAQRTPGATAFVHDAGRLTYAELARRASRLAHRLREEGVGPGVVAAVHLGRTPDLPVAVMAVLMTGGSLLPLEPAYPPERLAFMLRDSRAAALIACGKSLDPAGAALVDLDAERDAIAALPDAFSPAVVDPEEPACVIYTSGSTGRPKGGALSHRTILNRLAWMWDAYPLGEGEMSCQKTLLSFVDALWELLGPLLAGRPAVLVPDAALRDPEALVDVLAQHRVGRVWLVPSQLRALLDGCPDLGARLPELTLWVLGGEPVAPDLPRAFAERVPHARLLNSYGTSEIWDATFYDPQRDGTAVGRTMPIGRPIANVRTYVLDARMEPQPVGVAGELYVGGAAVGRGYLHDAGLRESSFVANPFSDGRASRLYRTGDVVRWLPDGCLEYLGRRDGQIKLRGFRIEPAEIEAALREQPGVRDAVVARHTAATGEPQLVAYAAGDGLSVPRLRMALRARLPEPMVPTAWALLDALPLTPSGKVDRRALPPPEPVEQGDGHVAPRTDLERAIAAIWAGVLGVSRVGVHESFFDAGGHSLLATQVVSRLRSTFRVDLPLRVLFETPTVAGLAEALLADPAGASAVERVAALVQRVSTMPEEEVRAMLAQRRGAVDAP